MLHAVAEVLMGCGVVFIGLLVWGCIAFINDAGMRHLGEDGR